MQFHKATIKLLALGVLVGLPLWWSAHAKSSGGTSALKKRLKKLDGMYPGQIGVFIKDLSSGETFSFRGEETWYIASGVKLPVALEVLRQVDQGSLALESVIEVGPEDYIDGAGETNYKPPGSRLSILFLLEQMMIYSDNTATDLLIQKVGLDKVNARLKELVPKGFGEVTTLADVRRHAYSQLHASAPNLTNRDFITLKKASDEQEKKKHLVRILNLNESDLEAKSLDEAFEAYYSKGMNSATLHAYTQLLEKLIQGKALSPESTGILIHIMSRTQTGKKRIKAGLPKPFVFAHKTGTQHRRACDFGIVRDERRKQPNLLLVASCARGFPTLEEAEKVLKEIGKAIGASGLLHKKPRKAKSP